LNGTMEIESVSIVMHFLIPVLVPTNDTRFPLINIDEEKKTWWWALFLIWRASHPFPYVCNKRMVPKT